jgi:UTP:GlnB (protein PII) uridylyltransferase
LGVAAPADANAAHHQAGRKGRAPRPRLKPGALPIHSHLDPSMQPLTRPSDPLDMPALYFEGTTPGEQARHREKLARLPSAGGMIIDPVPGADGGWNVEIVTMDWDEPGLLDKIFESILRCINIPEGIFVSRARIFTGNGGQVVNLLDLESRQGRPLTRERCELVLEQLRRVSPGERGVLDSIQHIPFRSLVPLVTEFPSLDNTRSDRYSFLELKVDRMSNRFTSVLLHFLARSELWLNIQVAEFRQEEQGHYAFYVVDKRGRRLNDSHFFRQSMVRTLEAMNRMLMQFNLYYIRRNWLQRVDNNENTIYHSRPDTEDFLRDLQDIRQMSVLKGFENRLSHLVEQGLLSSASYYLLKKVEGFVGRNRAKILALAETTPDAEQIELCREYFEFRRQALRVMAPLFQKLLELPSIRPTLSDPARLHALCKPFGTGRFALDSGHQLYITGPVWLGEPSQAMDPLLLLARTDCFLREDTLDSIEAAQEGWSDYYIEEHRGELGQKFMALFEESVRQSNTAIVLRTLRSVGLLQRFLPRFDKVQGLVHVVADHSYTVDEHTFVLIEVLAGLRLLAEVFPDAGKPAMYSDYEKLRDNAALRNYARKYTMELRMLARVTELRSNPAIRGFFQHIEEARTNSLDYLEELNLLDHGNTVCLTALTELVKIRRQLDGLIRVMVSLPFAEQRDLALAGLFHDLCKPAVNHPELGAKELESMLAAMGIVLRADEFQRIQWLVHNHLEMRPLMNRMGSDGERVVIEHARKVGNLDRLRMLILFTYADRVAVHLDPNKNSHDALLLTQMLHILDGMKAPGP